MNSRDEPFSSLSRRAKTLWIASTGGHLAEAHRLEQLLGENPESVWMTSSTPQSEQLLGGRRTLVVPYVAPRDVKGAIRARAALASLLRNETFDQAISTGAALAAGALPLASRHMRAFYVESLARSSQPSMTGRIVTVASRRVNALTQYDGAFSPRWRYEGSLLDTWRQTEVSTPDRGLRVFVTLGTIKPYRFDRAVDAVLKMLTPEDSVTWQLGATTRIGLPGVTRTEMDPSELHAGMAAADVVICHAGVGSLLAALSVGHSPMLAVRRSQHAEHVDDHQLQIAEEAAARGLGSELRIELANRHDLVRAASRRVLAVRP